MASFTDAALLLLVALVAACAVELRAIRVGLNAPRPVIYETVEKAVQETADAVVGAQLPHVLTDEEEYAMERQRYETRGAQGGHIVNTYWLEQEEREAFEEACSRELQD